jgi:hypothetical protein
VAARDPVAGETEISGTVASFWIGDEDLEVSRAMWLREEEMPALRRG